MSDTKLMITEHTAPSGKQQTENIPGAILQHTASLRLAHETEIKSKSVTSHLGPFWVNPSRNKQRNQGLQMTCFVPRAAAGRKTLTLNHRAISRSLQRAAGHASISPACIVSHICLVRLV